jgi:pimeloyl-ACP methyl ester carboxylesterase
MINDITTYLKYANVQMAAEALLNVPNADKLSGQLVLGNERASKFTNELAKEFAADWAVVEHKSNTTTGFSGTLFRCLTTDAARGMVAGQLVMSFRSTEFIDDSARDNQATNGMEIKPFGWAFGQIADMQNWYAHLSSTYDLGPNDRIAVTGYSLGGHLATAFNLLHPNDVTNTYTFNGAGVGKLNAGADLNAVINEFNNHRASGSNLGLFTDARIKGLYQTYAPIIRHDQNTGGLADVQAAIDQLDALITNPGSVLPFSMPQAILLRQALSRCKDVVIEALRVPGLSGGNDAVSPLPVPLSGIEASSLDYQLA